MTYTARVDELLTERFVCGPSVRLLATLPLPTPAQFVVMPEAFETFVYSAGLGSLSVNQSVEALSRQARTKLSKQYLPESLAKTIATNLGRLNRRYYAVMLSGSSVEVTLSHQLYSFTSTEVASGDASVLELIKQRWLELFTPEAIAHRLLKSKQLIPSTPMVLIQGWDPATASGTIATHSDQVRGSVVVEAVLGESRSVSLGHTTPDHYRINRLTGELEHTSIGDQQRIVTVTKHGFETKPYPKKDLGKPVLSPEMVLTLYQKASKVLKSDPRALLLYWRAHGSQVEFVYAKELDTSSVMATDTTYKSILAQGTPISPGSVTGEITLLTHKHQRVTPGSILVVSELSPYLAQYFGMIKGIVARTGGVTAHAAVLARESHLPVIVIDTAVKLKPGQVVSLNGSTGTLGIPKTSHHTPTVVPSTGKTVTTATKILSTVSNLEDVLTLPNHSIDGVSVSLVHLKDSKVLSQLYSTMGQRPIWHSASPNSSLEHWNRVAEYALKYKHTNGQVLYLKTPPIINLEQLVGYKTILSRHGIKRSVTTKVFTELATESLAVVAPQLQGIGIDGIIFNLEAIFERHVKASNHSDAIRWLEVIGSVYCGNLLKQLKQAGLPIIVKIDTEEVLERVSQTLVSVGIYGIEVPIALIDKARSQFYDAESHYLLTRHRYGHN